MSLRTAAAVAVVIAMSGVGCGAADRPAAPRAATLAAVASPGDTTSAATRSTPAAEPVASPGTAACSGRRVPSPTPATTVSGTRTREYRHVAAAMDRLAAAGARLAGVWLDVGYDRVVVLVTHPLPRAARTLLCQLDPAAVVVRSTSAGGA